MQLQCPVIVVRFPSNSVDAVSVTKVGDEWVFIDGIDESAIAWAKLTPTLNTTGTVYAFCTIHRLEYPQGHI